ncbi:hypothetical protein D3C79_703760 [compost metagenome]
MGQAGAVRGEEGHCTDVGLLKGLRGNPLQLRRRLPGHGGRGQGGQLFGNHLAALQQLSAQLVLLQPREIAAQHQSHQAGRQHGQQQYPASDSQTIEHTRLL